MSTAGLEAALGKMGAAGAAGDAMRAFARAYERLESGASMTLASAELEPVEDVPTLAELPGGGAPDALAAVVVIKLNGGLATTMGLERPKSLLEAREGRSFPDIIAGQPIELRRALGIELPLVLMDSDATRGATLRALAAHPELAQELPE